MKEIPLFAGIDVSKDHLDVAVRPNGEAWQVSHDSVGIRDLVERLGEMGPQLVVLEATGGIEMTLAGELAASQLAIAIVNPRQVRDFARAAGKLAKTDALDAQVLSHFAEAMRPASRPLPDADSQELGALVVRRRQLVEMITAEKNRMRTATARIRPKVQEHIRWLEQNLEGLDQELGDFIRSSPMWKDKDELLRSTPGVGPVLSMTLLSEPAGTGNLEPRRDRGSGGCGALQPGQRRPEGKTQSVGWAWPSASRPVHGSLGGHPIQSGPAGVLQAPVRGWQTQESGPHRLHAQAAHHTKCDGQA